MGRRRIQRVQDSVHGLMEFEGMETSVVEVLRAPELQRLRRVRQLGLGHLVFPGAEHSRLVHSIGAAHLATRFGRHLSKVSWDVLVDFLRPTSSQIRDLALAALFHDLGHGPLSHVWEREAIGESFNRRLWCEKLGLPYDDSLAHLKWHELIGQALLNWPDGPLHRLLEQQEETTSQRVRHLLLKHYYLPYLPRLLSGDIDVDRCDFVLRDAHQTGVAYGRYDLNWLISTTTLGRTEHGELVIGFERRKALRVVEQFLVARRALYETVYYHKTVRGAEGMIGLLLRRLREIALDTWPVSRSEFFSPMMKVIKGEPISPNEILGLDDYVLWMLIHELAKAKSVDVTLADLAQRIVARDLFKMVPCSGDEVSEFMNKQNAQELLKDAVSPYCAGESSFYYFIDRAKFQMLSESEPERVYFVDTDTKERRATAIWDHPDFGTNYWKSSSTSVRLFVPREAVEAIKKLVAGG